ncbi:MAG: Mth938-like domain-containing protein [Luteimonas sp.]|nr:Mth938-like domain-containing protein [Luteimonas sp.]
MQLVHEQPDFEYFLRGADGHSALVNDRRLTASFIIAPDRLVEDWPAADATRLTPDDLAPLLALQPELVVLGTGGVQVFPPPEVQAACLSRGIGLDAMTNAAAARTYTVLAAEGRRVVAGFLLG